jgi:DNA polymerase III subunit beta
MKFICTQQNLLRGLMQTAPLAGRNMQLPVLQQVLLEVRDGVLRMACTDLEVGARVVVLGKAEREGGGTVAARLLLSFVQQLPIGQPVVLDVIEERYLAVSTEGVSARFPLSAADDFPLLPRPVKKKSLLLDGRFFCQALARVAFAAAREETRPEIHSVFIKKQGKELKIAATDSFRLAEQRVDWSDETDVDFSLLLPIETAQEVIRLYNNTDQLRLYIQENYVAFEGEGVELTSRLVEGSYPDYEQIIPKKFTAEGLVNKDEFMRALKMAGVFLSKNSKRVSALFQVEREKLILRAEGQERGRGKIELKFKGKGKGGEVILNFQYLTEGAQHAVGDKCWFGFNGEGRPILLKPESDKLAYVYLVMPIQVE